MKRLTPSTAVASSWRGLHGARRHGRRSQPHYQHPAARLFRFAVEGAAGALLLVGAHRLLAVNAVEGAVLFGLVVLARLVPVALSREKPLTFTAAFVFAAALLLNGPAAGFIAVAACLLHANLAVGPRTNREYAGFLGAQYALAALGSHAVFVWLARSAPPHAPTDSRAFMQICAAALVFAGINGALVGLGNLGTRYARRSYAEPVMQAHLLVYLFSFPFAALLIFAYRSFGLTAAPILAALLFISAHAVRMTVEHRNLQRQIAAVDALGRSCASGVRAEMPLQRFLSLARGLVAFDRAVLWLADEGTVEMKPRAAFPEGEPLPDQPDAMRETYLSRAAERTEPLLLRQAPRDPEMMRISLDAPDEAWMLYPIVLHGRCIGVAQFIRHAARPFTQAEVARLATLVPQAAVAFESVRIRYLMHRYQDLMCHYQDMARRDGLTGLYNHRRCQELLRDELARATRYERAFAILMMDVDFFKQFNDTYGHPLGDMLLRSIAQIVQDTVRQSDFVGRYGGEEFMVILPETTGGEAYVLAERIRARVESEYFPAGEGSSVQKTISVGVASYPHDGRTAAELLYSADMALYRAKRTGKNRVLTA